MLYIIVYIKYCGGGGGLEKGFVIKYWKGKVIFLFVAKQRYPASQLYFKYYSEIWADITISANVVFQVEHLIVIETLVNKSLVAVGTVLKRLTCIWSRKILQYLAERDQQVISWSGQIGKRGGVHQVLCKSYCTK